MNQAQDPQELFDVITEQGEATGITKARAEVHRDGDWHRAVHIWVYGDGPDGWFLLMNQRGRNKDTWPLALDATVGGHLGAGESVFDAFREIREEIGILCVPERIECIFQRKRSSGTLIPGILDQELQEIHLLRDDRPLTAYAPSRNELEGLVQVSVVAASDLFRGRVSEVEGTLLNARSGAIEPLRLTPNQLLIRGEDTYFIDVITAVEHRVSK